jgi:hypothetical protein
MSLDHEITSVGTWREVLDSLPVLLAGPHRQALARNGAQTAARYLSERIAAATYLRLVGNRAKRKENALLQRESLLAW